jgi:hypothetical protein
MPAPRVRGRKRRLAKVWTRRLVALGVAAVAGVLFTFFTVDIGRVFNLKKIAETQGTKFIGRPMHIGKLSAYLSPGNFALDDVVIEGLTPDARPFLRAKRITLHVPWTTLFSHRLEFEVRMTDWTMLVEQWPDHQSFPHFSLPGGGGPSTFTKTVDSVFADRGEFIFEDHGTPWSVDVRNLNVDLVHAPMLVASLGSQYVGRVRSSGGTVQIQDFLPMSTNLGASFAIDKGLIRLHRIDLVTDGAVSHVTGVVDMSHWPEQTYQVDSRLDFHRMREIFFAHDAWRMSGEGRFVGAFHLYRGGRDLKGDFTSPVAGLNLDPAAGADELRFPNLRGSLDWLPQSFVVSKATSDLLGGRTSFSYGVLGFGKPGGADATFAAEYTGVEMGALSRYAGVQRIALAGAANGRASLAWRNGHFAETYHAEGATEVQPPEGRRLADRDLPEPGVIVLPDAVFNDHKPIGTLPIGAELVYRFDRTGIEFDPSWVSAPSTYVSFRGHVGPSGDELNLPVHATSKDWQASDRLLAAILTERHAPTTAIDVGGRGTFDGVLTESFRDLHTAGRFSGESIWAFGVRWSRAVGEVEIADDFVTVTHGVVGDSDASRILVDGRFAFGTHHVGDELTGTFKVDHWPLDDFKAAFPVLKDWPIEGTGTADLDLHGPYHHPIGTGTLRIDQGSAWQEPFETAAGGLAFDGSGVLLSSLELTLPKGQGHVRGNALINWDNRYSFDATGDHVAIENLHNFKVPAAPLSGQLDFRVSGAGNFDLPTYTFEGHVADLFAGDEGVGDVAGTLTVRGNDLTLSDLKVEGLVQATGEGRISLVTPYDAELTLSATDASIDPFLKFVMKEPPQLFRAVVSGSVRIAGPLADPTSLVVDTRLTSASLQLFDYDLQNDGPIHLSYGDDALSIDALKLQGTDTKLTITGSVSHATRTLDLQASGDANLAILQAFKGFGELRLGGGANLSGRLDGDFDNPRFTGKATLHDGRIRFPSLSRSLDKITGQLTFDNGNLDLSGVTGEMGGGPIQFGGVLRFDGFHPVEYQLTAVGKHVQVRYPEGFQTTADAELWMRGPVAQPTLGGDVTVTGVRYLRPLSTDVGLLALGAAGGSSDTLAGAPASADQTDLALAYDIHVQARSMRFIDTRDISVSGSAENLTVSGTVDQPIVTGRIDLDKGVFFFNGNRIRLVSGSISFDNPLRTEPFFDVTATTQAHVQQETFNITGHVAGRVGDISSPTASEYVGHVPNMTVSLTSDPYLSETDIYTLLLGGTTDPNTVLQRNLSSPQQAQAQLVQTMATQILTAPIASRVGDIVGAVVPLDTIQFVPLLGLDPSVGTGTSTSARVTLGKAVSDKLYLTYSRDVTTAEELILLEYTESDRVSWVLSRNEDHTFALDFRIRHIF